MPETMRKGSKSGHCGAPSIGSSVAPRRGSHARCKGGNRANPDKEFSPCLCACHLGEHYECGGCGRLIAEAVEVPWDVNDGPTYFHVGADGHAVGEDCPAPRGRN